LNWILCGSIELNFNGYSDVPWLRLPLNLDKINQIFNTHNITAVNNSNKINFNVIIFDKRCINIRDALQNNYFLPFIMNHTVLRTLFCKSFQCTAKFLYVTCSRSCTIERAYVRDVKMKRRKWKSAFQELLLIFIFQIQVFLKKISTFFKKRIQFFQ